MRSLCALPCELRGGAFYLSFLLFLGCVARCRAQSRPIRRIGCDGSYASLRAMLRCHCPRLMGHVFQDEAVHFATGVRETSAVPCEFGHVASNGARAAPRLNPGWNLSCMWSSSAPLNLCCGRDICSWAMGSARSLHGGCRAWRRAADARCCHLADKPARGWGQRALSWTKFGAKFRPKRTRRSPCHPFPTSSPSLT